jgi:hypothetical protein
MPIIPIIVILYVPAYELVIVCHVTALELWVNVINVVATPAVVAVTVIEY